jgi:PadR family transcriptional regulator PadR
MRAGLPFDSREDRASLRLWKTVFQSVHSLVDCLLESMPKREPYRNQVDLMQGTLAMLILRTLQWGSEHGHGIGQAIRLRSDDALLIEHGSLYPALHRLEKKGWLAAEWKASEANRRAKYYKLTAAGKRQLGKEQSRWEAVVRTVARVMRPSEGG